MYRSTTLPPASNETSWSLCVRDVVADLQPLSIDDLLDFAQVIA
ncbi:MAG: hypothetical protein WBA05_17970 [Gordonia sp. (in: high G+C Gram-positive bacteria)]